MSFISLEFAGFCGLAVLLLNLANNIGVRTILVVALNLIFAATFISAPDEAVPLVLFICVGYGVIFLSPRLGHLPFAILLAGVIGIFAWLKNYAFIGMFPRLPFLYSTIGLSYILLDRKSVV